MTDFLTSEDNLSSGGSSGGGSSSGGMEEEDPHERPRGPELRRRTTSEDEEEEDDDGQITSQATQGYSEGLADQSELDFSEVESLSCQNYMAPSSVPPAGAGHNPLQYSAMLKLYQGKVVCNMEKHFHNHLVLGLVSFNV